MILNKQEEDALMYFNSLGHNFVIIGKGDNYKIYHYNHLDIIENSGEREIDLKGRDVTILISSGGITQNMPSQVSFISEGRNSSTETKFLTDLEKINKVTRRFPTRHFWYINYLSKGTF